MYLEEEIDRQQQKGPVAVVHEEFPARATLRVRLVVMQFDEEHEQVGSNNHPIQCVHRPLGGLLRAR